ncbi:MAG: hypothetical protein R2867_15570 [Caldilineaceae bacterium]
MPGIAGTVDDADIIRFIPASLGETTIGSYELILDGSDVAPVEGLNDIVAIGRAPDGRLVISTKGYLDYNTATWPLDQILIFNATTLGENSSGSFEPYFTSGDIGLNDNFQENVAALWIDGPARTLSGQPIRLHAAGRVERRLRRHPALHRRHPLWAQQLQRH